VRMRHATLWVVWVVFAMCHLPFAVCQGQTEVEFRMLTMTGATNDRQVLIRPVHNPVRWRETNITFLDTAGLRLMTTNGLVSTNLVPNDYTVQITGVPRTWRISVPDTNTVQDAASLATDVPTYTYTGNLLILTNNVGEGGSITNFGALASASIYVAPDGNNTTGSRTDPTKPFLTPNDAQAVALPGDTVVIMPGFYLATNLGRDYVSWYLHEGATLTGGTNAVFALTNSTAWILGTGAVTNESPVLPILIADGSNLLLECRWRGTFTYSGDPSTVLMRNATIYSVDGLWISGAPETVVTFQDTSALNFPVTDVTLSGSLTVNVGLIP